MERDFVGYGKDSPRVKWPNNARLAVSFCINFEEGAEKSLQDGDRVPETIGEVRKGINSPIRDLAIESIFEYGSRVGFWRIIELLKKHEVQATYFASALALERNQKAVSEIVDKKHEICGHGYLWKEPFLMTRKEERDSIRKAVISIEQVSGERPLGWYSRYGPTIRTREILKKEGFLYDSDSYADDSPYTLKVKREPWVVVPYTMDANDFQFYYNRFSTGEQFLQFLNDTFHWLYEEGKSKTRMMSIGLHNRVIGKPGRIGALDHFLSHIKTFPDVWIARRVDIAKWWYQNYHEDNLEK